MRDTTHYLATLAHITMPIKYHVTKHTYTKAEISRTK